jgi:hypothetical protein
MAGYAGHLRLGFLVYIVIMTVYFLVYQQPTPVTCFEWLLCTLMGSLFPDIDIKSKGQKYFYLIVLCGLVLLFVQEKLETLAWCSIISLAPILVRHRGLFHQVWFVIIMPLSIWILLSCFAPVYKNALLYDILFFIGGALSHLWLDLGIRKLSKQLYDTIQ